MSAPALTRPPVRGPRRKPVDGIPTEIIPSATPLPEAAAHERSDPYWDRLWAVGSTALWATAEMTRARAGAGGKTDPRMLTTPEEAHEKLADPRGRTDRHHLWAVLDSWRTVSAEQAAALTGRKALLNPYSAAVLPSFQTGVIDFGMYSNWANPHPTTDRHTLYRPGTAGGFDTHVRDALTWPEWVTITGGYPWSGGGQYDRHNLLATELGLRAAEYLSVGTVLGEKLSTVDLLAGTGLGKSITTPDNRRADGTIVRTDGLRIVFELTATASPSFESKVRRWAQILRDRPLESSGLVIVFIAAPHPDRSRHDTPDPVHDIRRTIVKVLREFPGTSPDSPAARLGLAHWEDWFPAAREVSEQFFSLTTSFPTGRGQGPDRWRSTGLLTDYAFTPWTGFDATAVIENAAVLLATPTWLRPPKDRTRMIGSPMSRSGRLVPVPALTQPERAKGRRLGAGVGNAKDTRLPARLRV
ncbi:hypothetical protein V6N00_12730 [Tersicoccus sp. MR15.9]|uniref:hypothetical protein n=1 Tax=Tersicoccus mangrovi TaxID=3121635 RepID=UPI002FE63D98